MFPICHKSLILVPSGLEIACSIIGSISFHCFHYVYTLCKQGDLYSDYTAVQRASHDIRGSVYRLYIKKRLGFILRPVYSYIHHRLNWNVTLAIVYFNHYHNIIDCITHAYQINITWRFPHKDVSNFKQWPGDTWFIQLFLNACRGWIGHYHGAEMLPKTEYSI